METWVIVLIVVVILLWFISTNNKFRRVEVKIDEAYSDMDASIARRYNDVRDTFAAAKQYMKQEEHTLVESLKYRSGMSASELSEVNQKINECLMVLSSVEERYPELHGAPLFANVQSTVHETEEGLLASRRIYNSNVSIYNQMLVVFPSSIIGGICHFQKKEFFKATEEEKKGFQIPLD